MNFQNGDVVVNKHHPGIYYLMIDAGTIAYWPEEFNTPNCVLIRLNQIDGWDVRTTRPYLTVCNIMWIKEKGETWVRKEHLASAGFEQTGVNLLDVLGNVSKLVEKEKV